MNSKEYFHTYENNSKFYFARKGQVTVVGTLGGDCVHKIWKRFNGI